MVIVYEVTTVGTHGERYVGLVDGWGDTPEECRRRAGVEADNLYGRSCPGGLDLKAQGAPREEKARAESYEALRAHGVSEQSAQTWAGEVANLASQNGTTLRPGVTWGSLAVAAYKRCDDETTPANALVGGDELKPAYYSDLSDLAIHFETLGDPRHTALAKTLREYDAILAGRFPGEQVAAGFVAASAKNDRDDPKQAARAATCVEIAAHFSTQRGDARAVWSALIEGFEARLAGAGNDDKPRYAAILTTLRRERGDGLN